MTSEKFADALSNAIRDYRSDEMDYVKWTTTTPDGQTYTGTYPASTFAQDSLIGRFVQTGFPKMVIYNGTGGTQTFERSLYADRNRIG